MRVRDELLPSAISDCELVARSNGTDTQCRPAVGSAERLEDVEKVVMEIRARLAELEEFTIEVMDRIYDRIEALECGQRTRVAYEVFGGGTELD
jgi:Cu/Ag efflux pump CusA